MPIYEYRCPGCGRTTELMVRAAEADLEHTCDHCGMVIKRLPSVFAMSRTNEPGSGATCCGVETPCSDPKRCCER